MAATDGTLKRAGRILFCGWLAVYLAAAAAQIAVGGDVSVRQANARVQYFNARFDELDAHRLNNLAKGNERSRQFLTRQQEYVDAYRQRNQARMRQLEAEAKQFMVDKVKDLSFKALQNASMLKNLVDKMKDGPQKEKMKNWLGRPDVQSDLKSLQEGAATVQNFDRRANLLNDLLGGDAGLLDAVVGAGKEVPGLRDAIEVVEDAAKIGKLVAGAGEIAFNQAVLKDLQEQVDRNFDHQVRLEKEQLDQERFIEQALVMAEEAAKRAAASFDPVARAEAEKQAQAILAKARMLENRRGLADEMDALERAMHQAGFRVPPDPRDPRRTVAQDPPPAQDPPKPAAKPAAKPPIRTVQTPGVTDYDRFRNDVNDSVAQGGGGARSWQDYVGRAADDAARSLSGGVGQVGRGGRPGRIDPGRGHGGAFDPDLRPGTSSFNTVTRRGLGSGSGGSSGGGGCPAGQRLSCDPTGRFGCSCI